MHEWSFDVPLPIFFVFVATNPRWVPLHDRIWHKTLMGNCFSHMMVHVWWYIQCEIHATPITGFLLLFFFFIVFFFGVLVSQCKIHCVTMWKHYRNKLFPVGFSKKHWNWDRFKLFTTVLVLSNCLLIFFFIYDVKIKCIQ